MTGTSSNPEATAASRVPSPPSATGTATTSASGDTDEIPAATRAATSLARIEPLNLSGAIRIFMLVSPASR